MFYRTAPRIEEIEEAIDVVLAHMKTAEKDEFAKYVDQLVKLYKLKETETPKRVSQDTLVLVAGNLLGIILILGYERAHVVTSRALNFVTKLR